MPLIENRFQTKRKPSATCGWLDKQNDTLGNLSSRSAAPLLGRLKAKVWLVSWDALGVVAC